MRELKFRVKKTVDPVGEWEYIILNNGTIQLQGGRVDLKTLSQFTGLKDKYGKDIYEGDIVTYLDDANNSQKGVIKWDDTSCGFFIEAIGGDDEGNQNGELISYETKNYEVIGNIYENPEMMIK